MPHSQRSSTRSAVCRLEWGCSRWLLAALLLLSVMGPLAVLASEMPLIMAWPLAAAALIHGVMLLRRECKRPAVSLLIDAHAGLDCNRSTVDGQAVTSLQVRWRGHLATVSWHERSGNRRRLLFWPDVLPAPMRRELRLAAPAAPATRPAASMAP